MQTCTITIDGKTIEVDPEQTVFEAARQHGVRIPALCSHEALAPYGACRLCIVEVELSGKQQIMASCTTRVREGMLVKTDTGKLRQIRATLVELLLKRAPHAPVVQKLARDMGVGGEAITAGQENLCILCGMCVRVCRDIVGADALGFVHKGALREVAVPFFRDSQECVGCGACVFVCPTGHIRMQDAAVRGPEPDERVMETWQTRLELQQCSTGGRAFATKRLLEHAAQGRETAEGFRDTCPRCRTMSRKP